MYTLCVNLDLDLYRREVRVSTSPRIRLSAIDIAPERYQRTFVFIHGFGGRADQWNYQLQNFVLDSRVVALDLRGHGLSDRPPRGYDMPTIQSDLVAALRSLNVGTKIVLVGHSFGGAIAAEFALAHPDRIEGLVLVASPGEYRLQPALRIGLRLPIWFMRVAGLFTRRWLWAPPHVLRAMYTESVAGWIGWEKLRALRVPTLVVRGHHDQVFAQAYFDRVARVIQGAEETNIGSSGHLVMLERRDAVNRAIERFVSREARPSPSGPASWPAHSRGQESLRRERPWLNHYEPGVPFTICVPEIPLHHLLRSAVRRFPRRAAVFFEGGRLSYRQLNHEANRFANGLRAMGVGKGKRVILLLPNSPQLVIGFFGTLKAGAAVVFIPPTIPVEEIVREAEEADATAVVALSAWSDVASRVHRTGHVPRVILTGLWEYLPWPVSWFGQLRSPVASVSGAWTWRDFLRNRSEKAPDAPVDPDELAVLQYTGGTTGQAKGVMLSHRNLVANAMQTRHWMLSAREGKERFLSVVPIFHTYGLTTALNVPVALGASMILKARFEVVDILKAIRKYKPTIFAGVPSMYLAIASFRGVRRYGIRSIRACISGSEPLPVEVQESFEKLTRGHLVEGYGLTEASPVTHANPLQGERKAGSIGIPVPSTEATLFDLTDGRKRAISGQFGELAVRGPQVMMGYWKQPRATGRVLRADGWLLTGDVAQQDEDGYYRLVSRRVDMWHPSRPGKPAFPRDLEEVIYEIPQVREVAVAAIANRPIAFIIARGERPTAESIIAYCKRRLPPALVPRAVIFMDDFPRTFIGKVLRRELAETHVARGGR
jgi:long-chain acyl-CoA synthetase